MISKAPPSVFDSIPTEREMPDLDARSFGAPSTSYGNFDQLVSSALGRRSSQPDRSDSAPPAKPKSSERTEKKSADADASNAPITASSQQSTPPPASSASDSTNADSQAVANQGAGNQYKVAADGNAQANPQASAKVTDAQTKPGMEVLLSLMTPETEETGSQSELNDSAQLKEGKSQVPNAQSSKKAAKTLDPPLPPNGITTALDTKRMKFDAQKDEIAGRGEQKLPCTPAKSADSSDSTSKVEVKTAADAVETKKDLSDPLINPVLTAKFVEASAPSVEPAQNNSAVNAAGQVERLSRMVSQEVVMIKQSGASSLAVSLKVDAHTELFLQVSNHDGLMQASIRFERGNYEGLSSHWGQLQDSLARQNVHLLPLEQKSATRNSTQNPFSSHADTSSQGQPEQGRSRQARTSDDLSMNDRTAKATISRSAKSKTKTKSSNPDGWESWA